MALVQSVVDGDTINLNGTTHRPYDIDAPKLKPGWAGADSRASIGIAQAGVRFPSREIGPQLHEPRVTHDAAGRGATMGDVDQHLRPNTIGRRQVTDSGI
jgi:hypothetical protein